MAIMYVCKGCDTIIYRFSVGQDSFGLPTPQELKARVASRCPKCGRELSVPSVDSVIILKRGEARRILSTAH
ncbi:MAG: hypothetical protein RQ885_05440 [Desulfurococcales archaeon]|nr:hypothetical protein [Desulfurococcales archaeon]